MKTFSLPRIIPARKINNRATFTAFVLVAWLINTAQAADYFVPQTNDARPITEQLINAIQAAELTPAEADTIYISAGNYTFTDFNNDDAGYNALPTITTEIKLKGDNAQNTIIERDRSASTPIFRLLHVAATGKLTIEGLTLTGGSTTCKGDSRCTLFNFPADTGGAIFVAAALDDNSQPVQGELNVIDSILTNNYSENCGGAVRNDGGIVHIERSIISKNSTDYVIDGAGIYNDAHYSSKNDGENSKTTLIRGTTTVVDSAFIGNVAGGKGAAIFNENGYLSIDRSSILGNWTRFYGGGIGNGYGTIDINNSTIYGNYSGHRGGGIYGTDSSELTTDPKDSVITINNSTIAGNTAEKNSGDGLAGGGGIAVEFGSIEIRNSIVSGNSAPVGVDCRVNRSSAKLISYGNNIISNSSGCEDITVQGNNDLYQNPFLDACVSSDQPGRAHLPLRSISPAENAANGLSCTDKDQLGRTRDICDIGAVEYNASGTPSGFTELCDTATAEYYYELFPEEEENNNTEETPTETDNDVEQTQSGDENQSGATEEINQAQISAPPASGGGGNGFWLVLPLSLFTLHRMRKRTRSASINT